MNVVTREAFRGSRLGDVDVDTKDLRLLQQSYTHMLLLTGRQWRRVADLAADPHCISEAKALPLVMIKRMVRSG